MLSLEAPVLEALLSQAHQHHPLEACGVLVAKQGTRCVSRLVPLHNAAASETEFCFEAQEQLRVWRSVEAQGDWIVGIYHSHTQSPAYPSAHDIAYAQDPSLHYVIVSTAAPAALAVRSFRIHHAVLEETIHTPQGATA